MRARLGARPEVTVTDPWPGVLARLDGTLLRQRLRQALDQLADHDREVLLLSRRLRLFSPETRIVEIRRS